MGNVFMKEEITEPIELEFNEELLPICNSQINTVQELRVSVKSIKREPELSVEELEAQTNNEYAQRNCTLIANAFENKKLSVDLPDRSNITVLRDMKRFLDKTVATSFGQFMRLVLKYTFHIQNIIIQIAKLQFQRIN